MEKIIFLISLFLLHSCNAKEKENNKKNITLEILQKIESTNKIKFIDFRQNPAEEYFFTRKYRLTNNALYYFENDKRIKMNHQKFLYSKILMDSLPTEINNKKIIGHTTVDIDIPDWTINIHFDNKEIIYLASGGLPNYMKSYNDLVWEIITELDKNE